MQTPTTQPQNDTPIRVMVAGGSQDMHNYLTHLLHAIPGITLTAISTDIQHIGEVLAKHEIDIILLDQETTNEEILSPLPALLRSSPLTRIILISDISSDSAGFTIKALAMGVSDYVTKPESGHSSKLFSAQLLDKMHALAKQTLHLRKAKKISLTIPETDKPNASGNIILRENKKFCIPQAIAIGSSTGGPEALTKLFNALAGKIKHTPVFITQHLPPSFTSSLTDYIQNASKVTCINPQDKEVVEPGKIYLAPGDYHMELKRNAMKDIIIRLTQTPPENFCRPSVDPMLRSLVNIYGRHLLTVILTGMGKDGLEGCKLVTEADGTVIAQDQETSVVWGMPGSVATAGLCNAILPIPKIADYITDIMGSKL